MGNRLLQHWLMLTNLWMNQLRWRCWSRLVSDGGLGATLGLDLLPRQTNQQNTIQGLACQT